MRDALFFLFGLIAGNSIGVGLMCLLIVAGREQGEETRAPDLWKPGK